MRKILLAILAFAAFPMLAADLPDLTIDFNALAGTDPGLPYDATVFVANESTLAAAHDVVVTVDFPDGTKITGSAGVKCNISGPHVDCSVGDLAAGARENFSIQAIQIDRLDAPTVSFSASISGREQDLNPASNHISNGYTLTRTFPVTSVADSGTGSLRQAIDDANATDLGGAIVFRFDGPIPNAGWWTIAPKSALPQITTPLDIDGGSLARWRGSKANPLGPDVEITGNGVRESHGIDIHAPCGNTVSDLAVNGFSGNGINVESKNPCTQPNPLGDSFVVNRVTGCYLGVDPTGSGAISNGLRGIGVALQARVNDVFIISGNVLSGNLRSGVFVSSGPSCAITGNRIGVAANDDTPLPNGASGVFVATSGSTISGNVIANNHDFGIAVDRHTSYVDFGDNSIYANGVLGIDIGLDGPGSGEVTPPQLTRATYDAVTDQTTIEGIFSTGGSTFTPSFFVELYATDVFDAHQFVQGKRSLGSVTVTNGKPFTFTVHGDLRGQILSALGTREDLIHFFATPTGVPTILLTTLGLGFVTSEFSHGLIMN
jgi:hypothetical protein